MLPWPIVVLAFQKPLETLTIITAKNEANQRVYSTVCVENEVCEVSK